MTILGDYIPKKTLCCFDTISNISHALGYAGCFLDYVDGLDSMVTQLGENAGRALSLDGLNPEERHRDGDLKLMVNFVDRASRQRFEAIFGAAPNLPGGAR